MSFVGGNINILSKYDVMQICSFFLLPLVFPFKTLEASGLNVTMEDVANTDHFSIIEKLVDGEYHLTKVNMQTKPKLLKMIMNVSAFIYHSPCLSKLYEINILY